MSKVKRLCKNFGKIRLCEVEEYGGSFPNKVYESVNEMLWIERGEDEYGRPHYTKGDRPTVILYRDDWLRGAEQLKGSEG